LRLHVAAIGKLKSGPEKMLAHDYASRIEVMGRKAGINALKISDFSESQAQSASQRMAEEAQILWAALPAAAHVIALDERGPSHSSEAFAARIGKLAGQGTTDLAFLIGGADGHDPQTRKKANELMSFGAMTWPHRLVRIMLLEQIYRSVTILINHPYHRP
jgi:23S rRNA (pseudouridine1915-N3)-methyltransferase